MKANAASFQKATVDAICKVLLDPKSARRFLVADEPGLGKTVLARDSIEAYLKVMKPRLRGRPMVVYYITSDLAIAHQNKDRLITNLPKVENKSLVSPVERLGLIPITPRLTGAVELFAFTPHTSLPERTAKIGPGRCAERAFLYRLLCLHFPAQVKKIDEKVFQFTVTPKNWKLAKQRALQLVNAHISETFIKRFTRCIKSEFGRNVNLAAGLDEQGSGKKLLVRLRRIMSQAALHSYPPDLVILDEFQKYQYVIDEALDNNPNADPLIQNLFNGHGNRKPAVLLLSGTPYSSRHENAHQQLFRLLAFLKNDATFSSNLTGKFEDLRRLLLGIAKHVDNKEKQLELAKHALTLRDYIQDKMMQVMARTERVLITKTSNDQLEKCIAYLDEKDLEIFANMIKVLDQRDHSDALSYWNSIPYPVQAMGQHYAAWNRRKKNVLQGPTVRIDRIARLSKLGDHPHPKMRALNAIVKPEHLALPWLPPSLEWWPLKGPWKDAPKNIKLLLFSRFKAAPQSISSLLSYGVESEMLKAGASAYAKVTKTSRFKTGKKQFPLWALFHPSPLLVKFVDTFPAIAGETMTTMRKRIRLHLKEKFTTSACIEVVASGPNKERNRHRSTWEVLVGVEKRMGMYAVTRKAWKSISGTDDSVRAMMEELDAVDPIIKISQRELEDLVELAMVGPGVVLGRALYRHYPIAITKECLHHVVRLSWSGLRTYLDKPVFWSAYSRKTATEALKQAVWDGCLESVLDEHIWMRSNSLSEGLKTLTEEVLDTFQLSAGSFKFQAPNAKKDGSSKGVRIRCHAAVPFGGLEAEKREAATVDVGSVPARTDALRSAFNSPFWPHVLASTSAGQEGLDFHTWCSRIGHWDLCPSPIELEQREGRVSRYGGLAVREVLAKKKEQQLLREPTVMHTSAWSKLKEIAIDEVDETGLQPWWHMDDAKVRRYLFALPMSRDEQKYERLQNQRLIYRLALGHPNQDDLVKTLAVTDDETLRLLQSLALDLSPYSAMKKKGA
jgi:hypothetical protein